MKIIATGCEYTGVTSLFDGLMAWGNKRGIKFHLDDHFTIPDKQHLAPEDQLDGDMHFSHDFRSIYSTVLEQWLDLNPNPIVYGTFDQFENVFNI